MPGPPPKRSDERRRRNVPTAGPVEKVELEKLDDADDPNSLPFLIKQPIVVPALPEPYLDKETGELTDSWHPIAIEFWESLKRSGQALYWEPSDWMVAKLVCESISRDLKPQVVGISPATEFGPAEVVRERIPMKGASLGAYLKAFGQLMLTEGERRRLSIELERTRVTRPEETRSADGVVVPLKQRRKAQLVADENAGSG